MTSHFNKNENPYLLWLFSNQCILLLDVHYKSLFTETALNIAAIHNTKTEFPPTKVLTLAFKSCFALQPSAIINHFSRGGSKTPVFIYLCPVKTHLTS